MKSTRKMKILSVLMSAAMVFGTMPASIVMGASDDDIVQNSENTEDVSADDTGFTLSAYEGEDTAGEPVVEETVPESGYVEDESAEFVENAAEEVPSEEVTDENEYGIQMLATAPNVTYIDEDGNTQSVNATEVTESDTEWTSEDENGGWYVVDSTFTNSNRIEVSGEVNLILENECTLTVSSGITVEGENCLTIYGQSAESGALTAKTSSNYYAALGGKTGNICGTITINGGEISATAGNYSAAIGSGDGGEGGSVTINDGTVTAIRSTSGAYGALIGGGRNTDGGTIVINGGTVTATAGNYGAGIGGGYNGSGGEIMINDGEVTVTSGTEGAGIGGGQNGSGGTISISGGTITADQSSSSSYGAAIGGGDGGDGGTFTISGGTVNATSKNYGAAIGGGRNGDGPEMMISGGEVIAAAGNYGASIGGGDGGDGVSISISGGTVNADKTSSGAYGAAIGGGRKGDGGKISISGGTVNASCGSGAYGAAIGGGGYNSSIETTGGEITIDGGTINAAGGAYGAAIGSGGYQANGGTITINDGIITATSNGNYGAGIGGGQRSSGGVITINGGTITSNPGSYGSGIGGGGSTSSVEVDGGTITINGGTIHAVSGNYGAGIGGGQYGAGGVIKINGGTVIAEAGDYGAAIGGGANCECGELEISGGTVTATTPSDNLSRAAAIGGGNGANGGDITISGGTVTALSQGSGAGIGAGRNKTTGLLNTGEDGHAFIVASSISQTSNQSSWSGAIIIGSEGQVYQTPTLTTDAEVPVGDILLIPEDTSLTIGTDTVLTNSGTVYQNWGGIFNKNNSYVDFGETYYEIINNLEDTSLEGTSKYADRIYSMTDNEITGSLSEGVLRSFTLTEYAGSSETINGASFTMPDVPVTLSDAIIVQEVKIPDPDPTEYIYTGSEQTYQLETSEYYTIAGNKQTDAGTYMVTVSLNDSATSQWEDGTTEEKTYDFTILQAENSLIITTESLDQSYNGIPVEDPAITADFGTDTVTFTWYQVEGDVSEKLDAAPTDVGNYKVVALIAETENYAGASAELAFTIEAQTITEDLFDVDTDSETYTGSEIMKEILSDLVKGTDYTVSYENNVNAGTATIMISGIGNYTGTVEYSFTIEQAAQDISYETTFMTKLVTARSFINPLTETVVSEEIGCGITYASSDSSIATVDETSGEIVIIGTGVVTITATAAETENYAQAIASYELTVVKPEETVTSDFSDHTYNGNAIHLTANITHDAQGDAESVTYSFQWYRNGELIEGATEEVLTLSGEAVDVQEGTLYTCIITISDSTFTDTVEASFTVTIIPAKFGDNDVAVIGYSGEYDGKAHSITVTLSGAAEHATVTYSTKEDGPYTEENPEFTNAGTHTVYYKVSKDNYNEVTGSETVEITKLYIKTETTVTVTATDLVYNGSRQNAGIVVTATDGTVLEKDVDYILNGQTAKAAGTHKATLTGIGKYYGTTTVNYKIAKADQKLTAKVKKTGTKKYTIKASKLKKDSRTFKIKVTKKGKMKVRYSTSNSRIKVDKNGKVTLKKGLKAGTYKIKVTTGASKNYKASKNPKYITVKVK